MIDISKIGSEALSEIKTGSVELSAATSDSKLNCKSKFGEKDSDISLHFQQENVSFDFSPNSSFLITAKKLSGLHDVSVDIIKKTYNLGLPFNYTHKFYGLPFSIDGSLNFATNNKNESVLSTKVVHSFELNSIASASLTIETPIFALNSEMTEPKVKVSGKIMKDIQFLFASSANESSNELSYKANWGEIGIKTNNNLDSLAVGGIFNTPGNKLTLGTIIDVFKQSINIQASSNSQFLTVATKFNYDHEKSNIEYALGSLIKFDKINTLQLTFGNQNKISACFTRNLGQNGKCSIYGSVTHDIQPSIGLKLDIKK